jgi:hypothetical protein
LVPGSAAVTRKIIIDAKIMRILGQTLRCMPNVNIKVLETLDHFFGGLMITAIDHEGWHLEFVDFFNAYSKFFDYYMREHPTDRAEMMRFIVEYMECGEEQIDIVLE